MHVSFAPEQRKFDVTIPELRRDKKVLLEEASFSFSSQEKVCLHGGNGDGKSTLLTSLRDTCMSDVVLKDKKVVMILCPQIITFPEGDILDIIKHFSCHPADVVEHRFATNEKYREILQLKNRSPGNQRFFVNMVCVTDAVIYQELGFTPICLFDEPMNALDVLKKTHVKDIFTEMTCACIVVSHDDGILNECQKVVYFDDKRLREFSGNFKKYITVVEEESILLWVEAYEKQQQIMKLVASIFPQKNGKSEAKEWVETEVKPKFQGKTMTYPWTSFTSQGLIPRPPLPKYDPEKNSFRFKRSEEIRISPTVIKAVGLEICNPQTKSPLIQDFDINIGHGERIVIVGPNGSGKSLLLNALCHGPLSVGVVKGDILHERNHRIAYYDQKSCDDFVPQEQKGVFTALDMLMMRAADHSLEKVEQLMLSFKIRPHVAYAGLSGGERVRLAFCALILKNPTCLILDEPTNNLDSAGKRGIIQAIDDFEGSCVIVTHDPTLLEELSKEGKPPLKVLHLNEEERLIYEFIGVENYHEFVTEQAVSLTQPSPS